MTDLRRIFEENPPNPGYCLVIRPMNPEFNDFWEDVARAFKRTFRWTDVGQLVSAGDIMNQVVQEMARTDVVIADVSEASPNVFYELGIAHAMKTFEKVVIVTRVKGQEPTIRDVPFDVRGLRFLRYDSERAEVMREGLQKLLFDALEGTTWFHLAKGATHRSTLIAGDDGNYRFDVCVTAIPGEKHRKDEAVTIELTVYPELSNGTVGKPECIETTLHFRDEARRMCRIPHVPWRLRSEGHSSDREPLEAIICMVPERA